MTMLKFVINKTLTKSAVAIFAIIIAVSCTEDIDIKLDSTYDRLVVYGELTTDTMAHSIMITRSMDYYNPEAPQGVSGALVSISWNSNVIELLESDTLPGRYETPVDFYGVPNNEYTLTIENVDIDDDGIMEIYKAKSKLNSVNVIDSIRLRNWPQFEQMSIRLWAQDSISKDFYLIRGKKNGVLITDSLGEWGITDDAIFNGNNTGGIDVVFLDQNNQSEKLEVGDTVMLEVSSITEEFFTFLSQANSATGTQTPLFNSTPGNVRGNISNGAIGFFAAHSISRASLVVAPMK